MELNGTSYVILGMLKLGRRTGYEIKQLVDVSTRFFWAASYGQIYPELRRLAQAGLIEEETGPSGGRRRRAYHLTAAGERALREWLTSGADPIYELRDEALLKFFFADALAPAEAADLVRSRRTGHEAVLDRLRAIESAASEGPHRFPYLSLRFGIEFNEFIVGWCDRMERELAREARKAG